MKKHFAGFAVLIGFALNGCGGGGGGNLAGPTTPPTADAGKIAFQSERDRNSEIYIMHADGSKQTRVTNNPADDFNPAFSPDKSKIAFSRSSADRNTSSLFLISADGKGERRLTSTRSVDTGASFSPDGRKIVFSGAYTTSADTPPTESIYTINVDGGGFTRLTSDQIYSQAQSPVFSPDGRYIIYTGSQPNGATLFVINSDGSQRRRLTIGASAAISPDGRTVAFSSPIDGSRNRNISTINFDGTGEKILIKAEGRNVGLPAFSPDGRKIAFATLFAQGNADTVQIHVVNADGTREVSLTNGQNARDLNSSPDWR